MSEADDGKVPWERVATAAGRPAMVRGWGIPLYTIPVVVGAPIVLTIVTYNIVWMFVLIPALRYLVRAMVGDDHNSVRITWLGCVSGQTFADRAAWGGASRDPHDV